MGWEWGMENGEWLKGNSLEFSSLHTFGVNPSVDWDGMGILLFSLSLYSIVYIVYNE